MNLPTNYTRAIRAILATSGLTEHKDAIISAFTNGRTSSITSLTIEEAKSFISHLNKNNAAQRQSERQRKKIIAMAHELGWKLSNGKIDMQAVNGWCVKYGYLHKKLNAYDTGELPALVTQFEKGPYTTLIENLKKL